MTDKEEEKTDNKDGIVAVEANIPPGTLTSRAGQHRVRGERYTRIYANNLAIEFSQWDLSIVFGEILGEKDGQPVIEEIAHVTMSREFAKTVAILMGNNLKAYEKQFGEIKINPLNKTEADSIIEKSENPDSE